MVMGTNNSKKYVALSELTPLNIPKRPTADKGSQFLSCRTTLQGGGMVRGQEEAALGTRLCGESSTYLHRQRSHQQRSSLYPFGLGLLKGDRHSGGRTGLLGGARRQV